MSVESLGDVPDTDFDTTVRRQIERMGDQNHAVPTEDRYNPLHKFMVPVQMHFEYRYDPDGQISFGDQWSSCRLDVEDVELIYASKLDEKQPNGVRGEFYVHEFSENGLAARTLFTARESGAVQKSRRTRFAHGLFQDFVDFSRVLEADEVIRLHEVVTEPKKKLCFAAWVNSRKRRRTGCCGSTLGSDQRTFGSF